MTRLLGYPVFVRHRMAAFSRAVGFGPFGFIVISDKLLQLPGKMQGALLMHEVGHLKHWHLAKRCWKLMANFWRPSVIFDVCREQEYEADLYAAKLGYRDALMTFFSIVRAEPDPMHPTPRERIARLTAQRG